MIKMDDLTIVGLIICVSLILIGIRVVIHRHERKQPRKQSGFIERKPSGRKGIPVWEIEARLRNAERRTRNIKISPKHFPNSPAFEKQNWDRTKKPEEEK